MAQSTVDPKKLEAVSNELMNDYSTMIGTTHKLDELIEGLHKIWTGEGARAFIDAYRQHAQSFVDMSESVLRCSKMLSESASKYEKAERAAIDAITSRIGKA